MKKELENPITECREMLDSFAKNRSANPFLATEQWLKTMKDISKELDRAIELMEK